jgi:hypothetical protein
VKASCGLPFAYWWLPYKKNGKPLSSDDLSLSVGWGHVQTSRTGSMLVMPGTGLAKQRDYTDAERAALSEEGAALRVYGLGAHDARDHRRRSRAS